MRATYAVNLTNIRRAHGGEQHPITCFYVDRKVIGVKVESLRSATTYQ
jgi:hypothetical protein